MHLNFERYIEVSCCCQTVPRERVIKKRFTAFDLDVFKCCQAAQIFHPANHAGRRACRHRRGAARCSCVSPACRFVAIKNSARAARWTGTFVGFAAGAQHGRILLMAPTVTVGGCSGMLKLPGLLTMPPGPDPLVLWPSLEILKSSSQEIIKRAPRANTAESLPSIKRNLHHFYTGGVVSRPCQRLGIDLL